MNKITKEEYPNLWNSILNGFKEELNDYHRKGVSYYTQRLYLIDNKYNQDIPSELNGYWITDHLIHDYDWGCQQSINVLYRATEKITCNIEWIKVDDVKEKEISNYSFEQVEKTDSNKAYYSGIEYNIVYNGTVYGTWDNEKQIDCPEDLTLQRDLLELINIGIEIGKQMRNDELNI